MTSPAYEMDDVLTISSITGEGIDQLVAQLAATRHPGPSERRSNSSNTKSSSTGRCPTRSPSTRPDRNEWVVAGRPAIRAVRFQDLTDDEALAEIVRRLRALGVDRMLTRAGVRDGDIVTSGRSPSSGGVTT